MSKERVHILGICGTFMGGLALMGKEKGIEISGCDENIYPPMSDHLKDMGIEIIEGYDSSELPVADYYVIGNSISRGNPALEYLLSKKSNLISGPEWLYDSVMKDKKVIAVSGTHGKTTTTSLMATILENAKYDPTVINGGVINSYNSNAKLGRSDWMVVEADESDGSFLKLPASFVIVTNIDAEHIDFYKSFKELKNAFKRFINNIPFYGAAIICIDDPTIQSIISEIEDKKIITYGLSPQADFRATNIVFKDSKTFFSLEISPKKDASAKKIENMVSNIPGIHNVQNILSVCSMAVELGIDLEIIKLALLGFEGVNRRFSLIKNYKGIQILYLSDQ